MQTFAEFKAKGGKVIQWPQEDFDTMAQYSTKFLDDLVAKDPLYAPKIVNIIKEIIAAR